MNCTVRQDKIKTKKKEVNSTENLTIFNVAKVLPLHTGYDEHPLELCFYLIAVQCVLGRT